MPEPPWRLTKKNGPGPQNVRGSIHVAGPGVKETPDAAPSLNGKTLRRKKNRKAFIILSHLCTLTKKVVYKQQRRSSGAGAIFSLGDRVILFHSSKFTALRFFTTLPFRAAASFAVLAVFGGYALHASANWNAPPEDRIILIAPLEAPSLPVTSANTVQPPETQPAAQQPSPWAQLAKRLADDGFDAEYVTSAFAALNSPPLPHFMGQKVVELYARHGTAVLMAPEDAAAGFEPPNYAKSAGGASIAAGKRMIGNNKSFFEGLYKRYGVPAPFIMAVLMVETGVGSNFGKQSALLALGSMALTPSLEQVLPVVTGITKRHDELDKAVKSRSEWAYDELKALLAYAKDSGKDPWTIPGSVYGAIGMCQFMPSNIPEYAVSSSGKRPVPDLFLFNDAAASVAKYLSRHGWEKAATPMAQTDVLRAYNHSDLYAATVYGLACALMGTVDLPGRSGSGNTIASVRESARMSVGGSGKSGLSLSLRGYDSILEQ